MHAETPDEPADFEQSGDPLIDEIRLNRRETLNVGKNVLTLAGRVRWSRIREFVLIAIVALVVATGGAMGWVVFEVHEQSNQTAELAAENQSLSNCLAVFAAATADRTGVLAPLSKARNEASTDRSNAETDLILTALIPPPGSTKAQQVSAYKAALAKLQSSNQDYVEADRAYTAAADEHPPPPAPADGCTQPH